jgi:hypothetical protein
MANENTEGELHEKVRFGRGDGRDVDGTDIECGRHAQYRLFGI